MDLKTNGVENKHWSRTAVLGRNENGKLIRKAGIMGIVLISGDVRPGDLIRIELPPKPHQSLERV